LVSATLYSMHHTQMVILCKRDSNYRAFVGKIKKRYRIGLRHPELHTMTIELTFDSTHIHAHAHTHTHTHTHTFCQIYLEVEHRVECSKYTNRTADF